MAVPLGQAVGIDDGIGHLGRQVDCVADGAASKVISASKAGWSMYGGS
jgi:hypothetical protein